MASFQRKLALVAAACFTASMLVPAVLADDSTGNSTQHSSRTVIESTRSSPKQSSDAVVTESTETPDGSVKKLFVPKFQQRLNNLKEQIERGITKGWLTAEQSEKFKQQHEKAAALEADVRTKGYPKDGVDNLEKAVTGLNDSLSQALIKGSTPAPEKPAANQQSAGQTPASTSQSKPAPATSTTSKTSNTTTKKEAAKPVAPTKKPATTKGAPAKQKGK